MWKYIKSPEQFQLATVLLNICAGLWKRSRRTLPNTQNCMPYAKVLNGKLPAKTPLFVFAWGGPDMAWGRFIELCLLSPVPDKCGLVCMPPELFECQRDWQYVFFFHPEDYPSAEAAWACYCMPTLTEFE